MKVAVAVGVSVIVWVEVVVFVKVNGVRVIKPVVPVIVIVGVAVKFPVSGARLKAINPIQ